MTTPTHRHSGTTPPYQTQMGGVRPIYENFKPPSEWSQNDDTYILTIQVPGFMKEQLKVSTEDRNIIRVRGERLIAGNRWSRFQEDFQVPDNSKLTSVRAKHDGSTLTITVPRKNKLLAKVPLSPLPKAEDQILPPKTTGTKSPWEPERDQHGQDNDTQAIRRSKPITDDRSSESAPGIQKTSGDHPRTKIGREEDEQKSHIELTQKPAAQENIVDKAGKKIVDDKSLEPLGIKRTSSDHPSTRTERQEDEEKSYIEKRGIQEAKEKHHHKIDKSSATDDSPDHGALKVELKYKKKARKGMVELNEERKLLANMGAALLVIVGLSAYVAYNFGSQNAKR